MLTEKQRSFLKFTVLLATKHSAKGMITGLVDYATISSIMVDRIKNRNLDRCDEPGSNTAKCLQDELDALSKTLIDKDVLDQASDTILSRHLSKIKIDIFTDIIEMINDDSIIDNLTKEDIQFILNAKEDNNEIAEAINNFNISKGL